MSKYAQQSTRPHHRGQQLAPERIGQILNRTEWGVLSTVSQDGEPYAIPISFAWDEEQGELIIHTSRDGAKINNFHRDPRICFAIVGSSHLIADKFAAGYESLVIFGRIEEICDPTDSLRAATIFCRKFAPQIVKGMNVEEADRQINELAIMLDSAKEFMAMYRIIPEHISSKQRNMG